MTFIQRVLLLLCLTATPAILFAGFVTGMIGPSPGQPGPGFGGDFNTFYVAGATAARDGALASYDLEKQAAYDMEFLGRDDSGRLWMYPPTLLFLLIPLGLLPFSLALYTWTAFNALVLTGWSWAAGNVRWLSLAALAFPSSLLSLLGGQIGCLFAGLIGSGLLLLERRPVVAGICFGLASFKPQLGVLIPVALIAGRHWHALLAAIATTLLLAGASVVYFGFDTWLSQLATLDVLKAWLEEGRFQSQRLVTVFSLLKLSGLSVDTSLTIQFVFGLAMAALVAAVWWRADSQPLKISILIIATYLAAPYAHYYDMPLLALPLIWWALAAHRAGWLWGESLLLAAFWLLPILIWPLLEYNLIHFWPLVFIILAAIVFYRLRDDPDGGRALGLSG